MQIKNLLFFLIVFQFLFLDSVFAQNRVTEPYSPFRVIGNLYSVGGKDLSVFLITSNEGHILINTGWADSRVLIQDNIESLGFSLNDVKILLAQHAHGDHTGAMAEIKNLTGAQVFATAEDIPLLEDGGFSDPQFGGRLGFDPVKVDRTISQGDIIELGDNQLTVHLHPGHTAGATSFTMNVRVNGSDYRILIANMGSINAGKRLAVDPTYPESLLILLILLLPKNDGY